MKSIGHLIGSQATGRHRTSSRETKTGREFRYLRGCIDPVFTTEVMAQVPRRNPHCRGSASSHHSILLHPRRAGKQNFTAAKVNAIGRFASDITFLLETFTEIAGEDAPTQSFVGEGAEDQKAAIRIHLIL